MNIKRAIVLLCVFLQSMFALAVKMPYVLLDYDKAYIVDISVDTTMRLNQLPQYKNKKSARFVKPHKVHCDFKLLYLWKNNYVVRFVVIPAGKILKKDLNNSNTGNLFDLRTFKEPKPQNDSCLHSWYDPNIYSNNYKGRIFILEPEDKKSPDFLDDVIGSKLALEKNDFVELYKFYDIQIQRCNLSINPVLYYYFEQDQFACESYPDADGAVNREIEKYISNKLFIDVEQKGFRKPFLFPSSLPIIYERKKRYTYNKCYNITGNSCTYVKQVYNVVGKAIYVIGNKNVYPDPRNPFYKKPYNNRKVEQQYDFLYIPHVMYMSLGDFKYKISSINGIPLKEFMATYVDDFKPKLVVTKQAVPDPAYTDPTSPYNPFAVVDTNKIYDLVQVQPNFTSGMNALYDYLNKNLNYPPSAREAGVEGKVIIGFIVNKDGSISDVQVRRSLDPACDEEAVKLIKNMPKWTPGKQDDKIVRVRMALPVVFKLDNK